MPEQQVHEEHSNIVIIYNATRWVGQGLCGSVQEELLLSDTGDACC